MGAPDFPFRRAKDLHAYVQECFVNVVRGPEDMHDYQDTAVSFLLANPFSALFIDLGLGKTCISLTAIIHLVSHFEAEHILIVAPVRVANETWPTEIGLWRHTAPLTYVHIREDMVVDAVNSAGQVERDAIKRVWLDTDGQRVKAEWTREYNLWKFNPAEVQRLVAKEVQLELSQYMKSEEVKRRIEKARLKASKRAVREHFYKNPAIVHIINREQVEFLVDAWGRDWPYDCVVIDESSCLKDHRTGRFKALKRVRPLIRRMHQLTATPAAETWEHLFAQIYLLDQGKRFGKSITHFRSEYFEHNPYNHTYKLRPGSQEKIAEKIADICLTMKAEDYLKLEKPVILLDKFKLSVEQKRLYDSMEQDFIVQLSNGAEIEAETAAAMSQKLLQMASGVIYETVLEDDGKGGLKKRRVVHHLHDDKIEKLQTIVEEAQGESILVAYWHDASRDRLRKAFPKAVVMDKEGKCVKQWNARKIPMLLVHPQSAGHGLNLQHGGRRIVFFDIPWSLELYLQLIGRLARQGQKYVVMVHHLIAEGTLDEDVVEALTQKFEGQEYLFVLLKRIRRRIMQKVRNTENTPKCFSVAQYNEEL